MYEALFVAAETAGDAETAALARRIQAQEQEKRPTRRGG